MKTFIKYLTIIVTILCIDFYWIYKAFWWHYFFVVGFIVVGFAICVMIDEIYEY